MVSSRHRMAALTPCTGLKSDPIMALLKPMTSSFLGEPVLNFLPLLGPNFLDLFLCRVICNADLILGIFRRLFPQLFYLFDHGAPILLLLLQNSFCFPLVLESLLEGLSGCWRASFWVTIDLRLFISGDIERVQSIVKARCVNGCQFAVTPRVVELIKGRIDP